MVAQPNIGNATNAIKIAAQVQKNVSYTLINDAFF